LGFQVIHGGIEADAQSGSVRLQNGIVAAGINSKTDRFQVDKIFAGDKQQNPEGPGKHRTDKYGSDVCGPEYRGTDTWKADTREAAIRE
jgi:hypothetical protein